MEKPDIKRISGAALRACKQAAAALRKSPALSLATALGAGFLVGVVLRCVERTDDSKGR